MLRWSYYNARKKFNDGERWERTSCGGHKWVVPYFTDALESVKEATKGYTWIALENIYDAQPLRKVLNTIEGDVLLIVSSERNGISKEVLKESMVVQIPMFGLVPCLNVTIAGSIGMYEATA